jgi:FkbM family methyltransferase
MILPRILTLRNECRHVEAKTFWGAKMDLLLPEAVSTHIWRYGFFEADVCFYMLNILEDRMTFIDVGGHFGFFSLLGSYLVGSNGKVITFEPTPSTFRQLEKNTQKRYRYENIQTHNLAAYSSNTNIWLNDYGPTHCAFNSAFGLRGSSREEHCAKIFIKAVKVEDVIEEKRIGKVDLVKIDAESAEMHVLKGMKNVLIKSEPSIIIELGDFGIHGVPRSREIVIWLEKLGYSPYEYRSGQIVPHSIADNYEYCNLLFTRR